MQEENNTIVYDENWQNVSRSEYPVLTKDMEEETEITEHHPKKQLHVPGQYLLIFQLILCFTACLAAFVIKSIGGEVYKSVSGWYHTQMEQEAIYSENKPFDLQKLFGNATADEV